MKKIVICAAAALCAVFVGGSSIIETGRQGLCLLTSTQLECAVESNLRKVDAIVAEAKALLGPQPKADPKAFEAFLAK